MIKRIVWIGIIGLLLLYTLPKLLFQLSVWLEPSGEDQETQEDVTVLFPPVLDGLPEATNSAILQIQGFAHNAENVELLINNISKEKASVESDTGRFSFKNIRLYKGENSIIVVSSDRTGIKSKPSEVTLVQLQEGSPKLIVESPDDGVTINGSEATVEVRGLTEPEYTVHINGRWVRVLTDGTFRSSITLNEGDNTLEITAQDRAGNIARIERTIHYAK